MFNLDQAIGDWRRGLAAGGIQCSEVLDELESHLRDDIEGQLRLGVEPEKAFALAVQRVGATATLAQEFARFGSGKRARSALTPAAKMALETAREEALDLGHDFVGTEHVLLGVIKMAKGAVSQLLQCTTVDVETLRAEVLHLAPRFSGAPSSTVPTFTPRALRALRLAGNVAGGLKHSAIGADHLLLGLLLENTGVAAMALRNAGVRIDRINMRSPDGGSLSVE